MAVDATVSEPPVRRSWPGAAPRRPWAGRRPPAGADKPVFGHRLLPVALIVPELAVVGVFFIWPSVQALLEAFRQSNAFGLGERFSGLANFTSALQGGYLQAIGVTAAFTAVTTIASMALSLLLAVQVEQAGRFRAVYRMLFTWSYAVPGAVGATLWLFLFEPHIGPGARLLGALGVNWNFALSGPQAFALVAALTVWQQTAYNFVFFSAGLQAIPGPVVEAAVIDGAGAVARFWKVVFPLLGPTVVFVTVSDVLAALFGSFAVIDVVSQGGPGSATTTLVYMLYRDGFQNGDVGLAGAESIFLFALAGALLVVQFRVFSRRVHYR
jgi:sn-glycerol 3-phosphate transport system permease protein